MKTIKDGTAIKIKGWGNNEVAKVVDMGIKDGYKEYVTDEDRLFASAKLLFLSSDTSAYDREDAKYKDPVIVENGEIVLLESNNKKYKVINNAGGTAYAYYSDLLAFELVK